ncbi:amidase family protein [Pikeienuella sp. HZG-20]|uniref:amidase family protein n=1 Tax=Paludibacillus litoralis TaxID=3133267 RepID=UPI0030EED449
MASSVSTPCEIEEATIAGLQRRILAGELSSTALIDAYLARIARWDQEGPALRSVLALNPAARARAAELDSAFAAEGRLTGPLHGVAVAVKDNCDTVDMPTTGGALALKGARARSESAVTRKLAGAGAVILAKTNLHEFALSGVTASSLGGQTRNPYDLTRTPGGSSGGSGVAAAMSFATAAIGTDTVNSIRSPASANCLVGLRPTKGLVSRAGIMPVSESQDAVGPITRTVADAARLLDVIAGYDPDDPVTARCLGKIPRAYADCLDRAALKGRRIGVFRTLMGDAPRHREVNAAMAAAARAMRDGGAEIVEVDDPAFDSDALIENFDVQKWEFKRAFEAHLQTLSNGSVRTIDALLASGGYHRESLHDFLTSADGVVAPDRDIDYLQRLAARRRLRDRLLGLMAAHGLDALAYPLQKCLVVPINGGGQIDRNGIVAALTGLPALTVPMGFSAPDASAPIGVPMGMDLLARPFDEPLLLGLGYAFEQITRIRKPPSRDSWPG